MPVLQSLPVELLRQILSSLDRRELCKISLVSHFLKAVVEPFLYASLGGFQGWLLPPLRAIVTRPELASYVHRIESRWGTERYPTLENRLLFSTRAEQLGILDIGWWDDAQALFLVQLVPDVRELCINHTPLLNRFIESTLSTPIESLPFKMLVKFECDEYSQQSSVTLTMLLAVMRMPSIREIAVDMEWSRQYTHDSSVVDDIIAFAGKSTVTRLSLHYGNMTTSMLAHILRMPRALKHFSYIDDEQYPSVPDTTRLDTALATVRPTLQSLSFSRLQVPRRSEPGSQAIGGLQDWPALTSVDCSFPALIRSSMDSTARLVDVLPVGIQALTIRRTDRQRWTSRLRDCWPTMGMAEQLVEVLQNRELERLTVDTCAMTYWPYRRSGDTFPEDVKDRLEGALGTGRTSRCEIVYL